MNKKIKYAGVIAAALLAVAPVASSIIPEANTAETVLAASKKPKKAKKAKKSKKSTSYKVKNAKAFAQYKKDLREEDKYEANSFYGYEQNSIKNDSTFTMYENRVIAAAKKVYSKKKPSNYHVRLIAKRNTYEYNWNDSEEFMHKENKIKAGHKVDLEGFLYSEDEPNDSFGIVVNKIDGKYYYSDGDDMFYPAQDFEVSYAKN